MSAVIERAPLSALTPYRGNARTHSPKQIEMIARSIKQFGFVNPVLVDDNLEIIAGHGRVAAAKKLGLSEAPVLRISHLSEAEKRAYVIADNRLAEKAGWDRELLAIELQGLIDLDVDVASIGFEPAELDLVLDAARESAIDTRDAPEDQAPPPPGEPVTEPGDLYELGRHRLICGDATCATVLERLMGGERAHAAFTDPPYNVPIDGFVGGRGKVARREFVMASGEMSPAQFEAFLKQSLGNVAQVCADGAIVFVCMDWRHVGEMLAAGSACFHELKNICVWTKSNGGMGTLYRSQHEFVFVFKHGQAPHRNNVELGRFGRNRTNVWAYAGVNAFGAARDDELSMHPTVKPVAMVEDALKDVTRRGDLVLDPFGGSGSTLIAAEKCGRQARLVELDPAYCDVIVKRFEAFTGKHAVRQRST